MKVFTCEKCGNLLFFDALRCAGCQLELGFDLEPRQLLGLRANGHRACANRADGCNWLAVGSNAYCTSCQLSRVVPDLTRDELRVRWRLLEREKRRLLDSLLHVGLRVEPRHPSNPNGLAFDLLGEDTAVGVSRTPTTGHSNGIITIDAAEADHLEREKQQAAMGERYRTVLGHLRHEMGHYFWSRLVPAECLAACRGTFGDERCDYGSAIKRHHESPRQDWRGDFISQYASSHPAEDWAETFAHYLHLCDVVETAEQWGILPAGGPKPRLDTRLAATRDPEFNRLISEGIWLTLAHNELNRSMGHRDAYPFVLGAGVTQKLQLVHQRVRSCVPSADSIAPALPGA